MTSPPTTVVATDDDAELSVWVIGGDKAGQCVTLLHGFSLDHSTWLAAAGALQAAGYKVVLPDLRGHGRSSLGSAPPTVDRMRQRFVGLNSKLSTVPVTW